jgi:hypothetical protein
MSSRASAILCRKAKINPHSSNSYFRKSPLPQNSGIYNETNMINPHQFNTKLRMS